MSYINPENSDDIISEAEAENFAANDVHKLTFTQICQELVVLNKTQRRFKRYSTEDFTGHLQDLFKYRILRVLTHVTIQKIRYFTVLNSNTPIFFRNKTFLFVVRIS